MGAAPIIPKWMRGFLGNSNHLPLTSSLCGHPKVIHLQEIWLFSEVLEKLFGVQHLQQVSLLERSSPSQLSRFYGASLSHALGRILVIGRESLGICSNRHLLSAYHLPGAVLSLRLCYFTFPPQQSCNEMTTIVPVLQRKTPRFKEVEQILWISSEM